MLYPQDILVSALGQGHTEGPDGNRDASVSPEFVGRKDVCRPLQFPIGFTVLTTVIVLLLGFRTQAQTLTASAPSQVQVGQRFQVSWELNANGSQFTAPEIAGFQVLGGPNQSTSMQFINGSMSQSVAYSYVLRAQEEGEFNIGPAQIKSGGKTITSNKLTVKVVKGKAKQNAASRQSGGQGVQQQRSTTTADDSELFARIEVSKRNVYLGERITANLKIYSRVSIVNFDDWKMPSFEGFWMKETGTNQQIQLQNEVIDGVMYQTGLIKQVVLYPQKSGEITIDPMELSVIVRERTRGRSRSMFDQFFGGYQDSKRPIRSNSVKIKVKPYPSSKPADFSGLTGKFKLRATLDPTTIRSNEAANLKVTISGDGNLYQLQPLKLTFPPDIEAYDPKTSDNIKLSGEGVSGSRTFEYVLIPRYAGEFEIGPFSFSYFDPSAKQFKTVTQEAFMLSVEKGEGEEAVAPAVSIANKEDIKMIGSDIRYIKQGQYPILSGQSHFYRSPAFYAALGLPIGLFVLLIGYAEFRRSQGKDIVRLKSRKATGLAKKRLKEAKKLWDQNLANAFYEEVFKALNGYAADKFAIPVAELNKDRIHSTFTEKGVPNDIVDRFVGVLDKSEFARFAPGADKEMGSIYEEALGAIVEVEGYA